MKKMFYLLMFPMASFFATGCESSSTEPSPLKGHIVDIVNQTIIDGELTIKDNRIAAITPCKVEANAPYYMPGFVDAHMHIESTMLMPDELVKMAVQSGTVGVLCDPHEISNVCGKEGFDFMYNNAKTVPRIVHYGVPSCVPATPFETSGAEFTVSDIKQLLAYDDVYGLAEMMNFPAIVSGDPAIVAKVNAALDMGKVVDGHAPGIRGAELTKYIQSGISTDHECVNYEEAEERIKQGMYVLIREGSAARNFEALYPLIKDYGQMTMFCTDDLNPEDLPKGHINLYVRRAIEKGMPLWNVLRTASTNAKQHFNLQIADMHVGDTATFIAVDNLKDFNVLATYVGGKEVWSRENGLCKQLQISRPSNFVAPNKFNATALQKDEIAIPATGKSMKVIMASDGSLYTGVSRMVPRIENGMAVSDTGQDMLKYVVYNRYDSHAKPALAFIHGFGLKRGALASSVAHDSHNICAVGTNDDDIIAAINYLIEHKGGIVAVDGDKKDILPLPVAGLMSDRPAEEVAVKHVEMIRLATELGAQFKAPYMTMAFMSLLVIPELKLSDKGLFDGVKFNFTPLEDE